MLDFPGISVKYSFRILPLTMTRSLGVRTYVYCTIAIALLICVLLAVPDQRRLVTRHETSCVISIPQHQTTRGGHYHRPRVTICDRDQNFLIRKNGFDHLIYLKNIA